MAKVIEAEALTTFEVTADGSRLCLHVEEAGGTAGTLSVPVETLTQLMMTLPRMAQQALRRRYCDDSLRIVYPVGGWAIESSSEPGKLILTLRTPDGFEVSFALDAGACTALTDGLAAAPAKAAGEPQPVMH